MGVISLQRLPMQTMKCEGWMGPGLALLLLACSPLFGQRAAITAQTVSYQVGHSRSWGQEDVVLCNASGCFPSKVLTLGDLNARLFGVGIDFWRHRFFWLESGAILTKKGWTITGPQLERGSLELPLVLHVGYMPSSTGLGLSIAGGGALDVPADLSLSRPAVTASAQVHLRIGDRLLSGGIRYVRHLSRDHGFYLRTRSYFVSFSPHL